MPPLPCLSEDRGCRPNPLANLIFRVHNKKMLTVIETPVFQHLVQDVMNEEELDEFKVFIAANPEAGDVIPRLGDLRKVRWKRPGTGKRGGARVIYYLRLAKGEIVLIGTYAKAKFDNLPDAVLKRWKKACDA